MAEKKDQGEVAGARGLARLLDDFIRIPGTNRRIGLDPLLGLIPGGGDFFASAAGLGIVMAAARKQIKMSVYVRMLSNWAANSLIGAIPFVGDVFSFWFKSNRRNYALMEEALGKSGKGGARQRGGSWLAFGLLIAVALVVFSLLGLALWGAVKLIRG